MDRATLTSAGRPLGHGPAQPVVVATPRDCLLDRLRTGEATSGVLLTATRAVVTAERRCP